MLVAILQHGVQRASRGGVSCGVLRPGRERQGARLRAAHPPGVQLPAHPGGVRSPGADSGHREFEVRWPSVRL